MSEHPPAAEPWPEPAALPVPDAEQEPPSGHLPARNYLARPEQRRIFWRFMPPALIAMLLLGWVERSWFASVPAPVRPQVDTKVAEVPADPNLADAIVIEAEPDPLPGDADEYGAPVDALARIRDDTVFRGAE